MLKASPEKSDRSIAKVAKVSHHTVAKARKQSESRGHIAHVAKRTDSKGRKQPATKPARPLHDVQPTAAKPQAVDLLGALQSAWDAAPAEVKQEFVETNVAELGALLAQQRKKATSAVADRAIEKTPPPPLAPIPPDYPELPGVLDRRSPKSTTH